MDSKDSRYAFVHLDVDLYQSTSDCCKYLPASCDRRSLVVSIRTGLRLHAVKRMPWTSSLLTSASPITLPTGQAFVLKVPS